MFSLEEAEPYNQLDVIIVQNGNGIMLGSPCNLCMFEEMKVVSAYGEKFGSLFEF
jgi:exonuclease VII large subunit